MKNVSALYSSRTLRLITIFAGGNFVATILGLTGTVVMARYLEPETVGRFRSLTIAVGFLTFLNFGVTDGIQRQLPYLLGSGDSLRAEQEASACLAFIASVCIVCSASFIAFAIYEYVQCQWLGFWGCLSQVPVLINVLYGVYLNATYRTGGDFARLSFINICQAVIATIMLPVIVPFQFYGLCFRAAIVNSAQVIFLHVYRPLRQWPRFDWMALGSVVRIGMPLGFIGYVGSSLWWSLENTIVLYYLGQSSLGVFSIVFFVRQILVQLISTLQQLYMPLIARQYGESKRITDCINICIKPVAVASLAIVPPLILMWLYTPLMVRSVAPKYEQAIIPIQHTIPVMLIILLRIPIYSLSAGGRLLAYGLSVSSGFACFLAGAFIVTRRGGGLLDIVDASMFGYVVQTVVGYMSMYREVYLESRSV